MAKVTFNTRKTLFTCQLDLNLRKKLVKCYMWSIALYDAEAWELQNTKFWNAGERRRRSVTPILWKISVKDTMNILHTIKWEKVKWIGHILPSKTQYWRKDRRDGIIAKRCKQLLHELKEERRYSDLKKRNSKQHSVEHLLSKRLWTCHKTDYIMNGLPMF